MNSIKLSIAGLAITLCTSVFSQNVAINTTGAVANSSAMLDITSTNSGLLIPRVALTATNTAGPITTPATSLMVYNTATAGAGTTAVSPGYYYWDGVQWVRFVTGALPGPAWMVTGNAGTNPSTHFAGTTDAVDFVIRTNNTERMRVTSGGNLGVGVTNPAYNLELNGTFGYGNGTSGSYRSRTETRNDAGQMATQSGFYETSAPVNFPAGASSWWHLLDVRHSNNANNYALQIAGSFFDQNLYFRKTNNNGAQAWSQLLTSTNGWMTTGNAGTNAAINFVGTTDNVDFVTRTNNSEKMRVTTGGSVGIGITGPTQRLDVQGGNARINNVFLGDVGHGATWGGWSHSNQATTTGYGILESSDGAYTLINKENTGSGYIGFRVANADQAVILNNGNMGVGTTGPSTKLHVIGDSDNLPVIWGQNTNTTGGTTAYGVRGECGAVGLGSAGVSGVSTNLGQNEIGVVGDYGLWGAALFGLAWASSYADMPTSRDFGLFATCNFSTGTGVYARDMSNAAGSYAFYGTGKFAVTGTKSASVPTTKGNQLVYCTESPEIWFEDLGSGKLINGQVHIALDDMYLETIFISDEHPMHVFLQEQGECNGLIVIPDADNKGFTVKEKNGGTSNITFSYRIMAKRRFYQDQRFGVDPNQPFGNNLEGKKDAEVITSDPEAMKQWVDEQTRLKEESMKEEILKKRQEQNPGEK